MTCAAAAADKKSVVVHNATAVAGHPIVLNCLMPVSRTHVVWLDPTDSLPIPLHADNTAAHKQPQRSAGPAARFVVIGNTTAGEHHLLIRYTMFPKDAGRWTCVSLTDSHLVQHTQLMVLLPPATQVQWYIHLLQLAAVLTLVLKFLNKLDCL